MDPRHPTSQPAPHASTASEAGAVRRWLLLTLVLLVAAVLRLWGLPGVPPGPHYDEAANGVLAAEIAHGVKTSIFIPSYTGKEVLFFYVASAWMRLLGTNLLALRLTSAVTGLLTVAAAAWLAYELFADDDREGAPWLAALTATLLATSFWHVLLSRVGFRAITQPLLQALTLAALWRGMRLNDLRWLLLGGLFCGLTAYTYLAARAFPVPLALSFVALLTFDAGQRRRRLGQFALFGLAALAIFTPLGLYFLRYPDAFSTRIEQVGPGGDWGAALDGVVAGAKMIFLRGDPYVRFNLPFRPLFGPIVAFLFLLGLSLTLWRLFQPRKTAGSPALARAREVLLLAWLPVMLLPTALAINEITPSNLRAVGLIPLVFIFPARGVLGVGDWGLEIRDWVLGIGYRSARNPQYLISNLQYPLALLVIILLCATAFVTARAYFYEYAPRADLYEASDGDLADVATYLNQTQSPVPDTLYVGSIHYRHPTLAFLADAYPQIKWLVGGSNLVYPAGGAALYLFPRSAAPDPGWLARHLTGATPVEAPVAADEAPAFVGYYLSSPPRPPEDALADFSGVVRVLSYQVERAVSGAEADVTVMWQILSPPPHDDLTPFYHLTDLWGFPWGRAEPFHYAAADWTPGEVVVDRLRVPIAPGAPPGDYRLNVGLYSQSADARLAVVDQGGRYAGTTVPLTVTVARAERSPDPDSIAIRQRLNMVTLDGLSLLGVNLDTAQARPGERVHLGLFWRAGRGHEDYAVDLFLQGVQGNDVSLYRGAPVHGTYPTQLWMPGEIVVDRYDPRLPLTTADAPPGDYALVLTLAGPDGAVLIDSLVLGQLELVATDRTFELPAIRNPQPATLAEQVEFLGYDLDLSEARPGGRLRFTLYWRALAEMAIDYTVFTHLLGAEGEVLAQQDNPPVNGTYPTTLWLPGEIVTDPYVIDLPVDLNPGDYPIQVGFYVAENGLRLDDPITLDAAVSIAP